MAKPTYACVLTRDIDRLDSFYRAVLQLEPRSRNAYREFQTQPGISSLWSLEVENVDHEYERLRSMPQPKFEFVLQPTTLAWGNRSISFRDPDWNLVNSFTRVDR